MTDRCTSECLAPPAQAAIDSRATEATAAPVFSNQGESRPSPHRIVSIVAAFLFVVAVAALWLRPGEYGVLYGKLLQADANRLCEALASLGIRYAVSSDHSTVYVPRPQIHFARLELARKGIAASAAFPFDIVNTQSGPASTANRHYLAALEQELAATLGGLPDVTSARVIIHVPGNRGRLNGERPFATVVVQTTAQARLSDEQVRTIQLLVSSTTDLLTTEQVAVAENLQGKDLVEFNPDSL